MEAPSLGLELACCPLCCTVQVKASHQTSPASRGGEKTSSLDERSFQVTLQRGLGTGKRTMVAVFSSNLHTPGSLLSEKVQVGAEWEEGATVSGLRRDVSLEERGPTPHLPFCKIIIKGLQL